MFNHVPFLLLCVEAIALVMALAALFVMWKKKKRLENFSAISEDIFNTPWRGMILFDEDEKFLQANDEARRFMSLIADLEDDSSASVPSTLRGFLDYMFDHAVEVDESLRRALKKISYRQSGEGFREVVKWGDENLCLVESYESAGGRYIMTMKDLSDIKREEDYQLRLNSYSHKLTHAVEAATNGIIIARRLGHLYEVVFANKAFYRQSGLKMGDVLGGDARQVFSEFVDDQQQLDTLKRAFAEQEGLDFEIRVEQTSEPLWFNVQLTPMEKEGSGDDIFIAVLTDITELKMRETELSRTQKLEALGQLAAGVAHDFNNILSIISGYLRIAMKNPDESALVQSYMEKIESATERGARLTSQLLTFSRHKIVVDNVIDLSKTLEEYATLLQSLMPASVNFVAVAEHDNLAIECASDHIMQIIMNLCVNARDALPDGGQIILGACRCEPEELPLAIKKKYSDGPMACLYVSDTGTGIDEETLEKIFDPFFTTKDQGKGTGLGLFMVYGFVKQMGGHIDVRSTIGRGTTISLFWPLSDKKPTRFIEGTAEDIESINLQGYTVLVAEDEPDLLLLVSDMLERIGMKVITAVNGNEALLKHADHDGKIDLLLTDVAMPELNGVKLAELFKAERPDSKVIFMSGYPANAKEVNAPLPENAIFMAKPLKYEALARVVFRALKEAEANAFYGEESSSAPRWMSSEPVQKSEGVK